MTQEELEESCRYWQGILRLQDWDIEIKFSGSDAHRSAKTQGTCEFFQASKRAYIEIVTPEVHASISRMPYDPELTVVHELLHLHIDGIGEEVKEVCIEQIAKAFVRLRRSLVE